LHGANAWVQYNGVVFEDKKFKSINVKALSKTGGTLQMRLDKVDGSVIAQVEIPKGDKWNIIISSLSKYKSGIHNLIVQLKESKNVEVDWISFSH
jgi:hypothetical protein